MTIEKLSIVLGWCTVINLVILLLWFLAFSRAQDVIYLMHGKWFKVSRETFNAIHYTLMGLYKVFVLVFNLVPFIALKVIM